MLKGETCTTSIGTTERTTASIDSSFIIGKILLGVIELHDAIL